MILNLVDYLRRLRDVTQLWGAKSLPDQSLTLVFERTGQSVAMPDAERGSHKP